MNDLQHGQLKVSLFQGPAFPVVLPDNTHGLRRLVGASEDKYLLTKLGHLHHIVGNVEEGLRWKHVFDLQDDLLSRGLIHVGEAFVHDQKIEVLQEIACEVDAVLLSKGKLRKARIQTFLKPKKTNEVVDLALVNLRRDLRQMVSCAAPSREPLQIVRIEDGAHIMSHHAAGKPGNLTGYDLGKRGLAHTGRAKKRMETRAGYLAGQVLEHMTVCARISKGKIFAFK